MKNTLKKIYDELFVSYGPQGWWPLVSFKGTNPTKTGSVSGYHVGKYNFPKTDDERFEICIGAILTQNTAWPNVELALRNLKELEAIEAKKMLYIDEDKLKVAIKPAGYFNQKAKKLLIFCKFYLELNNKTPTRNELLNLWGIGPETADSILLYAYKVPTFVVDTYTRRIFGNLGFVNSDATYDEIKLFFEKNIAPDLIVYQEFHALIVEHAKRFYKKKEDYDKCPLYVKYKKK